MLNDELKILDKPDKWKFIFADREQGNVYKADSAFKRWLKNNVDSHSHIEVLVGFKGNLSIL